MSILTDLPRRSKIRREAVLTLLELADRIVDAQEQVRAAGACRAISPVEMQDALVALDQAWMQVTNARPVVGK